MKLKEALLSRDGGLIKEALERLLAGKMRSALNESKKESAKTILSEEEEAVVDSNVEPKAEKSPVGPEVKFTKSRPGQNLYRYQFPFKSRIFVVDFKTFEEDSNKFTVEFYAKGFKESEKFSEKFGITSINQIEPVFKNVLKAIEVFLQTRKPQQIRFLAGDNVKFPNIFHQYIYPALQDLEKRLKKLYTVVRGDSIQDGAAFVLKKGGAASILRNKSWKPGAAKEVAGGEVKEEIANVTGAGVSTDIPFKPMGEIARRKKPQGE